MEKSPFSGIYKLLEIARLCKHVAKLIWVNKTVIIRVDVGYMESTELSSNSTKQKGGQQ